MRRRIASLLGATLVASSLALLAPTSPASADTNVCVGQGTANTGALTYPVSVNTTTATVRVEQPKTVGFAFIFGLGTCAPDLGKTLTAGGTLTGYCGHSSGTGTTSNGHRFAWVSAGSFLLLTGEVTGLVNAIPDPLIAGNSCATGASTFIVTGVVVLTHCLVTKSKTDVTVPIPPNLTTTAVGPITVGVHTGPMTYHIKVCV